jgi:predicted ribosomally synthesized peptide with nif11-like leader
MKEQVKKFWEKLDQNEDLKRRFKEAETEAELENVIKEAGFSFGVEAYRQTVKEMAQETGIEQLTDDDMDKVAGGEYCEIIPGCMPICRPACHPGCDPLKPCAPNCAPCPVLCGPCPPRCGPGKTPCEPADCYPNS